MRFYKGIGKPLLDFLFSLIILLLIAPLIIIISLLLFIVNSRSPFFIQTRPGKHGRIFNLIKFKTMNDKRDKEGKLLPDYQRLTPLGKWIRKTSLDELPQFINVLKGEMSIIGPRPLLVEYLPLYNDFQNRRHEVKPGITGWAQVKGRNALTWEEKFKLDVWYVDHISFLLDIKILFITFWKIFRQEGISVNDTVTMEKFTGTKK